MTANPAQTQAVGEVRTTSIQPKRRPARRYDLWMRHPDLYDGTMRQISNEHHSQRQREDFLQIYLKPGWINPELRPVTCDDRLLLDRITRAAAALNTAPDVDPAKATRTEVAALHAANAAAWAILTEGSDPPSRRGADVEPPQDGA